MLVAISGRFMQKTAVLFFLAFLFNGCAMVGPDYTAVVPDAPQEWSSEMAGGLNDDQIDPETLARWWTVLNDPVLVDLENEAVSGNLDLKAAYARVREARGLRGISRAGLFPFLNASASASKFRLSENSNTGSGSELYTLGFDAGWEMDIFGGVRRKVEAADAGLAATRDSLNGVLVSLTAEVALNYVEVRTYQARLIMARENLKDQQQTYELNKSRYEAGLIGELPMQQSLYNLESTRSQVPPLEIGQAAAMNRLAVLLGKKPGNLAAQLAEVTPVPVVPVTVAIGVPADALRRRPDISQAERELAAQTARIGVATADLYPKFRLDGFIGLESIQLSNLPEWASRVLQVGPVATWNIFDAGAIRSNIEVQNARQEQALIQYQATVLRALEETENSLVAFVKEQDHYHALARATEAAAAANRTAQDRYQAGLIDFTNVLDAQRSLLSFKDELAQSTGALAANLVRLYKSLGGGWMPEAGNTAPVMD
jgi:NodT family efflux transporter outer membrane factor (OMF) lipoprotein